MKQDLATKSLEAFPDVFADIGNVNLYDGEQVIVPEELEQLPSEMICQEPQGGQRELRADIRMRIKRSGTEIAIMSVVVRQIKRRHIRHIKSGLIHGIC